jgi:hypothetical protein
LLQGHYRGRRLQLDGGTRPGPSWSLLLNLPLGSPPTANKFELPPVAAVFHAQPFGVSPGER